MDDNTKGSVEPYHGAPPESQVESLVRTTYPTQAVSQLLHHLQDLFDMSSSTKTGRPRGRRAAARVPCDECIARASSKDEGASIELCEKCTSALKRPRRKQQEQANIRKVRRQSNAIIDTAL